MAGGRRWEQWRQTAELLAVLTNGLGGEKVTALDCLPEELAEQIEIAK